MAFLGRAPLGNSVRGVALLGLGAAAAAIVVGEKLRPLRAPGQVEPTRSARNLVLGALSMAVIDLVETPLVGRLARSAERERRGLVQRLPLPPWARDTAAILLMDYTIYLWHVATHRVPVLWRFHLVHHVDLDLDSTTALRFHAADMAISAPYRALQVALIGVSPRALAVWRSWFFLAVLFHHSNLSIPEWLERRLAWLVTTPRMHGIHHSAVRDRTNSNWSSGFSFWDRLHGTFRLDVPQDDIPIGVPGYRDPSETAVLPSLAMPFGRERDAWAPRPGATAPSLARTKPDAIA